jgi:hypothetical protein
MYRIEITTPTPYETILKESIADTWTAANDIINTYKNYDLDNVEINLYKQKNAYDLDCWEYIDNFKNINKKESLFQTIPEKKKSKKIIKTAATAAGLIAAFPVMVTTELIKKS